LENKEKDKGMNILNSNTLSLEKKDVIRLTLIMSSSVIIGRILSIPSGIVTAKFLGPSLLGVLAIINLIIQYASYSQLGLLQSMPRDIPIAYGKGDKQEAKLIVNAVFTGFFFASVFSVFGLWLMFIIGVTFGGILNVSILIMVTSILIMTHANSFLKNYIKAEGKFMIMGKLEFILKIFIPAVTIPAVIFFRLKGALSALLLTEIFSVGYYLISLKKIEVNFYPRLRKILNHLKTGFMIFINQINDSIFWSIDLLILAAMMTTSDVGLYSIALGVLAIAPTFSRGVAMKVYRKIMVDGGKYVGSSRKCFRKYTEGIFVSYLLLNSLILGLSILAYIVAIRIILTRYMDSIPLMIILGFGYMIYTSRVFPGFYLNVTNQLHKRLIIFVAGIGLNVLLDYILITMGYGKEGVAFACSFSFLFISVLILGISFNQIYGNIRSALFFFFKLCSTSAVLSGILIISYKWNIVEYTFISNVYTKILWGAADFAIKGLIFVIFCFGSYFLFFKKYHLYRELKPIFNYVGYQILGRLRVGKKQYL